MTTPQAPISVPLSEPGPEAGPTRRFDFDHIPKLGPAKPGDRRGSLLPQEGGRAGLTYLQAPLRYARQLEAAGWFPMFDACRYTIIGPKGHIDMELMAQGREIRGVPASGVKCRCLRAILAKADGTRVDVVCEETGLDPRTGFPPEALVEEPTPVEEQPDGQEAQTQDPGLEGGGQPRDPEPQDPQGEARGPEPDPPSGSRKGRGHPRAPKEESPSG